MPVAVCCTGPSPALLLCGWLEGVPLQGFGTGALAVRQCPGADCAKLQRVGDSAIDLLRIQQMRSMCLCLCDSVVTRNEMCQRDLASGPTAGGPDAVRFTTHTRRHRQTVWQAGLEQHTPRTLSVSRQADRSGAHASHGPACCSVAPSPEPSSHSKSARTCSRSASLARSPPTRVFTSKSAI